LARPNELTRARPANERFPGHSCEMFRLHGKSRFRIDHFDAKSSGIMPYLQDKVHVSEKSIAFHESAPLFEKTREISKCGETFEM
jgi:hypothetical protein